MKAQVSILDNVLIMAVGDTALHIAVRENNKKMVELLFEYGCDPNKRNKKKQIPQDNCSNNPDLSRFLQELCSSQKVCKQFYAYLTMS